MQQILLFALLGLLVGILVNRAADNLPPPTRRSLFRAPCCPYCGSTRQPIEQSGIATFLFSGGRCRQCHAPQSLRAPLVELGSAFLYAYLWSRFGAGWPVVIYSFFTSALLLITVIDFEHRLILNNVVLPATALALVLVPFAVQSLSPSVAISALALRFLAGAATGYLLVLGIYLFGELFRVVAGRLRGQTINQVAFGMGDVKLAGLVGALVGFPAVLAALVYTIIFGGLVSAAVLIFQVAVRGRYSTFMAIPYGPFFTVVTWLMLAR